MGRNSRPRAMVKSVLICYDGYGHILGPESNCRQESMQTKKRQKQLSELIDMDSPSAVLDEVVFLLTLTDPSMDPSPVINAFNLTVSLYRGYWPAEQACNTGYHDLRHITDTTLAMMRLIHGAFQQEQKFTQRQIFTSLVAAMIHDSGYIQDKSDLEGTGAKYTLVHVDRSIDFAGRYGRRFGLTSEEIPACQAMIKATDLAVNVNSIPFPSDSVAMLARMLAVADLVAQMGDRIYLEKLLLLYREFREGSVSGYRNSLELLNSTVNFYHFIQDRFQSQLAGMNRFLRSHFHARWGINTDLYAQAMENHHRYLVSILQNRKDDPRYNLRRKKIVQHLKALYGPDW